MNSFQYADISIDDLSECAAIYSEVFNSPPWSESWSNDLALARLKETFETPGFMGLKVISDDKIVGFIFGYIETYDSGGDYYLKEMCVSSLMQRQGLGSSLVKELKSRLIDAGARKLYLLTARGDSAALFYEKNGFYISEKMIMMGHWLSPNEGGCEP